MTGPWRPACALAAACAAWACSGDDRSQPASADASSDLDSSDGGDEAVAEAGRDAGDTGLDAGADAAASVCSTGGPGLGDCGPGGAESCCASAVVPGGTFYRGYDGVTQGHTSQAYPAQVTGLRLDRFEVTVGRFREYVAAAVAGWTPAPTSGKHAHLNGGLGLNAGTEGGWDATWNASLATTLHDWNANLSCDPTNQTWTPSPAAGESRPINCVDWYEAYAFCIWDGGFLPSEAEWNYAAAGGAEQRAYPWSSPPTSTAIDCTDANYAGSGCGASPWKVGTASPAGDARWGHADVAGDVWEWTLDWATSAAPYVMPCADCADLTPGTTRAVRGGAYYLGATYQLVSHRFVDMPSYRGVDVGVRCARVP